MVKKELRKKEGRQKGVRDGLQRADHRGPTATHIAGDVHEGVQKLKDATPAGVLLGSGNLAPELCPAGPTAEEGLLRAHLEYRRRRRRCSKLRGGPQCAADQVARPAMSLRNGAVAIALPPRAL